MASHTENMSEDEKNYQEARKLLDEERWDDCIQAYQRAQAEGVWAAARYLCPTGEDLEADRALIEIRDALDKLRDAQIEDAPKDPKPWYTMTEEEMETNDSRSSDVEADKYEDFEALAEVEKELGYGAESSNTASDGTAVGKSESAASDIAATPMVAMGSMRLPSRPKTLSRRHNTAGARHAQEFSRNKSPVRKSVFSLDWQQPKSKPPPS
ncbi:hypothetical protein EJ08DRAFT_698052 [Tothia fuscella]|uniref:Uncharacterized protein n=1 Tax=Tothia fuscella TaxID=1048955 RepID=A0A9P4TY00_9PEZI|nr:hypothetical protein EJ08DRAFT_698052 [Tothia fuscella]